MSHALPPRVRAARLTVLACCLGLILLYTVYTLLLPPRAPLPWLVQVLPLALILPGLLRNRVRVYQWTCFLILIYFTAAVLTAFTPDALARGLLASFFCVLLFASAIVFISGYQQHAKRPGTGGQGGKDE